MAEMLTEIIKKDDDTQHGKYLAFALGKEMFGIEICFVIEIVGMQKINYVPELPDYIKGIINLRGKIITVIDMRLKFKKSSDGYTDRTCIVVIEIEDITVGLIVDNVDEVIMIPDASIDPPPSYRTGFQNRYIKGIGKVNESVILLLNCERLFIDKELQSIKLIPKELIL